MYKFISTFIKDRAAVELEKTQTRNSAALLLHFEIPIFFLVSVNVYEQSFPN